MGSFSSVFSSISYLKIKKYPHLPVFFPAFSHFCAPCSQQNYLKRVTCPLVYPSSLSVHSLTLSSWASVFSALLRLLLLRSFVTSVLSKTMATCPFLCYLMVKEHLIGLTSPSSLKYSFTVGLYNITLWWLWRCAFSPFMRISSRVIADWSLQLPYP